ncbi:hypothetical protein V6R21_28380 [Limibacter armeniacum]|uniref:hypothetical protein n=1 Tax=Limibacter armeniacum TaxID=466084 RepID=UPI002FE6BB6C
MNKSVLSLTIIMGLSGFFSAQAQYRNSKVKHRHFEFGVHAAIVKNQDKATSPLMYKGPGFGLQTGFTSYRSKAINHFYGQYTLGLMEPVTGNELSDAQAISNQINFGYRHLRHILGRNEEKLRWWAGGNASVFGNLRYNTLFSNSAFSYELYPNLGLSSRLEYDLFKTDRHVISGYHLLDVPLLGYAFKTFYATTLDVSSLYGNFAGIGTFPKVDSEIGLTYSLFNGNKLGIAYLWNYYSYNSLNVVKNASHGFKFSILFQY